MNFTLPPSQRTTQGALLGSLLERYLIKAQVFRRAVGFFSVSSLEYGFSAYARFFRQGGRAEFVFSPAVDRRTLEALVTGTTKYWRSEVTEFPSGLRYGGHSPGYQLLLWALSSGAMRCKVALLSKPLPPGIYHEKIGLMLMADGREIGFEGSANETAAAYRQNFERVRIYDSGDPDRASEAAAEIARDFRALWRDRVPGLRIIPLETALREDVLRVGGHADSPDDYQTAAGGSVVTSDRLQPEYIRSPEDLTLRDYQENAIEAWLRAGGVGVLSMATGSGKTLTALSAVARVRASVDGGLVVIFVAPLLHLVDQWIQAARPFGLSPIRCAEGSSRWLDVARSAVHLVNSGRRETLSLSVSTATFGTPAFQSILDQLRVRTILIADEVHNLGSQRGRDSLPDRIKMRLGLSATPERWRDEEGTAALLEYFGAVVYEFGLREALQHNPPVLTPYRYHPVLVDLTAEEVDEYIALTDRIGAIYLLNSEEDANERAFPLLIKRARLLGNASAKLEALREAIVPFIRDGYSLVYTGDGSGGQDHQGVEEQAAESRSFERQIDQVTHLLGNELGMRVAQYTAATSPHERRLITERFQRGDLQALIAIRCLDEGVDIPSVRRAFILASSTNPRQFIQRRGRILRKDADKTRADIFDFIPMIPPQDRFADHGWTAAKRLAEREMVRVTEFAELAVNGAQARLSLEPMLSALGLNHL